MNPFLLGKSTHQSISNRYPRAMTLFRVTGTLVKKEEETVTIELGNQKLMELRLKNTLQGRVGDQVSIERNEIINSRLLDNNKNSSLGQVEAKQYGDLLKEMKISVTEEALQAIRRLDQHGLPIKRDNILGFMATKGHLEQIVQGLDYHTALHLIEQEMDLEKDSLQQVAQAVKEGKKSKEEFSFFKLFNKKKELSTEQAEAIAKNLYGSKMGKDLTDIIKALHQSGTEVKKSTINRVNEIFRKVNELKESGSETFIDAVKNKVDASIDSLYKLKKAVVKNPIASHKGVSKFAASAYDTLSSNTGAVSEGALKAMEEEIRGLLETNGLEASQENVNLAKDLVKAQVPVTKDNIEKISNMQRHIGQLSQKLDYEKTAILLEAGVDIEKESLDKLIEKLQQMEIEIKGAPEEKEALKERINEVMKEIEGLQKVEEKHLIQLLKLGADFNLKNLSKLLDGKISATERMPMEGVEQGIQKLFTAHINVMKPLKEIGSLSFNTIAFQMKNQLPMSLNGLAISQQILRGEERVALEEKQLHMPQEISREVMEQIKSHVKSNANQLGLQGRLLNMEGVQALIKNHLPLNQNNMLKLYEVHQHFQEVQGGLTSQLLAKGLHAGLQMEVLDLKELAHFIQQNTVNALGSHSFMDGLKRIQVMDILQQVDLETLAFHKAYELPMTPEVLEKSTQFLQGKYTQQELIEVLREIRIDTLPSSEALDKYKKVQISEIERGLNDPYSREGQQYKDIIRAEQQLHRIIQGLNKSTIEKISQGETPLEKMSLEEIIQHVEKDQQKSQGMDQGSLNQMLEKLQGIGLQREHVVSLLLKNAMPLNLKEVQGLSLFLKNQEQVGHQMGVMMKDLAESKQEEITAIHDKMKGLLHEISSQVKSGNVQNQRPYEELGKLVKELEGKQHLLEQELKGRIQQTSDKLLDSLEIQSQLNKEDTVLQLPFSMENHFKNLQIYVMNEKRGSKKIDPNNMSVLLNFDTNHMGNMNIYVAVTGKKVVMKMGVTHDEDQRLIEAYEKQLKDLFEALGYELKEVSYRVEEDQHILTMMDDVPQEEGVQRSGLDIRI